MSHQMLSSQVYIHLLARVHVIRIEYVYNTDWLPCLWQLVMFGYQRALFVEYVEKNNIAMKHMYLQQWDPSFETMPYPPATGLYAIYTATDLVDHINFAMNRVSIWVSTVANNFHDVQTLKSNTFYFVWTILGVKRWYLSCHNDSCTRLKCTDIPFNLYEIIKSFNVFLKENDNTRFNK